MVRLLGILFTQPNVIAYFFSLHSANTIFNILEQLAFIILFYFKDVIFYV
jgi:hypothetical protein